MRSRSTFGLSLITLVFRDGTEDYWSRQRITERIAERDAAAGLDARPRSAELADRADPLLHARVRHEEPARALRDPALDRDPAAQAGAGRRRRGELRRPHHPVPARARSAAAHALQPLAQERHRRDQRQQRERRRQRARPRRARLRRARHRPGADARRHGQHRRHPAQRHADLRARPRQAQARQPGAPRHPRQGRHATTRSRAPCCCCAARIPRACSRACTPRSPSSTRASKADDVQIVPYLDRTDAGRRHGRQGLVTRCSRASASC